MQYGRVYRYQPKQDRLNLLIDTGQSPNGIVLNQDEDALYITMARGNSAWRLPLMAQFRRLAYLFSFQVACLVQMVTCPPLVPRS